MKAISSLAAIRLHEVEQSPHRETDHLNDSTSYGMPRSDFYQEVGDNCETM